LFNRARSGTKYLIEEYNELMINCLKFVCDEEEEDQIENVGMIKDQQDESGYMMVENTNSNNSNESSIILSKNNQKEDHHKKKKKKKKDDKNVIYDPISTSTKLAFFNEIRHSYGRTALLLSGGAALGFYHVGLLMLVWF